MFVRAIMGLIGVHILIIYVSFQQLAYPDRERI
jgi:hypothetical protein